MHVFLTALLCRSRQKKISAVWLSSFHEQLYLGVESGDVLVLNINAFEFAQESVIYLDAATQR